MKGKRKVVGLIGSVLAGHKLEPSENRELEAGRQGQVSTQVFRRKESRRKNF